MDYLDSFGDWLRQRREALRLTRPELADCAGCSVSALRKIEADERRPSRQLAELLAGCLRVPIEEQLLFQDAARGVRPVARLGRPAPRIIPQPLPSPPSPSDDISGDLPSQSAWNLPSPATPLLGREAELATLIDLLGDPDCRLLTLVGPGGIGKTRLAIEVSGYVWERFTDGVFLAPLEATSSSEFMVPAIAQAVALNFAGPTDPRLQLVNYLSNKQMLLLLDNLEHLLDGVDLVVEVLKRAPKLKLLATSRERLELQGEWVFEVQGLPVPAEDEMEGLETYSSVQLFLQRARQAQVDFELSVQDCPEVVRICRMVEGMPLAIELAATWVPILSCTEIADEIEHGLDILTTQLRDVPERQRSLQAVFDYSWKLLDQEEQWTLRKLSVFRGGFQREAAKEVAGASLSMLSALESKSFLRRTAVGRYGLHELVRQYAATQLAEEPEEEMTAYDIHCDYYLAMLQAYENALKGSAQHEAIRALKDEIGNVRVAWNWAIRSERFVSIEGALRSFALLSDLGGWLHQGVEQLELVVQALRAKSDDSELQKVLGQALTQQGDLLFRQGYFDQATARFEESLFIIRPINDPALMAGPLVFNGAIMHLSGEIKKAETLMEEGLACAQKAGDRWFTAYALLNKGYIAGLSGHHPEGYEQMLAGLDMWRAIGDPRYTAMALNFISPTAVHLGYFEEAQGFLRESLTLCTQVGDRWGMGTAYRNMGLAALAQGDVAEAQSLIQQSLDLFAGFSIGWDIVQSNIYLGEAAMAVEDLAEARRIFLETLPPAMEARVMSLVMDILIGLADLDARSGKVQRALELSFLVRNHTASTQITKDRADLLETQVEDQLASRQTQKARERARTQKLETIVAEILGEEVTPGTR